MSESLLTPEFLFHFAVPCYACDARWNKSSLNLSEAHRLPSFSAELNGAQPFADLRLGWNSSGLFLTLQVEGTSTAPRMAWGPDGAMAALRLWIDTRDARSVHRATRFCHQICYRMTGPGHPQSGGILETIARAAESPKPVPAGLLPARWTAKRGGYRLEAWIPGRALTGWDPVEQPRMGFEYSVIDSPSWTQTLSLTERYPTHDPSLWSSLDLMPAL